AGLKKRDVPGLKWAPVGPVRPTATGVRGGRYALPMFRSVILAAAGSSQVERLIESVPLTRNVVDRFVAGTRTADALRVTSNLVGQGLAVTLDYLGEDTTTPAQAEATRDEYLGLLDGL